MRLLAGDDGNETLLDAAFLDLAGRALFALDLCGLVLDFTLNADDLSEVDTEASDETDDEMFDKFDEDMDRPDECDEHVDERDMDSVVDKRCWPTFGGVVSLMLFLLYVNDREC